VVGGWAGGGNAAHLRFSKEYFFRGFTNDSVKFLNISPSVCDEQREKEREREEEKKRRREDWVECSPFLSKIPRRKKEKGQGKDKDKDKGVIYLAQTQSLHETESQEGVIERC